jgi:hypothetical protein
VTDTVQCWLVERDVWDEDVVTLVYATTDGEQFFKRQLASDLVYHTDVTAGRRVAMSDLEAVRDAADRQRYRDEAQRMASRHDPDDVV